MHYINGPLEVTRPESTFLFAIEVGQGVKHQVYAMSNLEESVSHLLQRSTVPAFRSALEDLQKLGRETDWDWARICQASEE